MAHHKHLLHRHEHLDNQLNVARDALPDPAPQNDEATVVSVVYVTAEPTFSGPIGGYITLGPAVGSSTEAAATSAAASSAVDNDLDASSSQAVVVSATAAASSTAVLSSSLSSSHGTTITLGGSSSTLSSSSPSGTSSGSSSVLAASSTASSTSSASSNSGSSSGMTTGAKAGLAIGLILGLGVVLGLILFCLRRKKNAAKKLDDEKAAMSNNDQFMSAGRPPSTRTARTASTAPRLSLRPVTEFLPNLASEERPLENPFEIAMAPTPAVATSLAPDNRSILSGQTTFSATQRAGQLPANDPANPFGNHAERSEHPIPSQPTIPNLVEPQAAQSPGSLNAMGPGPQGSQVRASAAMAAGAVAGALAARSEQGQSGKASEKPRTPSPVESTRLPPSPSGSEFSTISSSVSGPNLNGAGGLGSGPLNVHRVQLDFKPSMEDELELRAGELVRLLHEYDDGWALCIRLDRSKQGVVPRTCLSTRPIKPQKARPHGPPRGPPPVRPSPSGQLRGAGPSSRPMSPASGRGSPAPHAQPRMMSPAGGRPRQPSAPHVQPPRSMSPGPYAGGHPRPMSPAGRPRSMSAGQANMRKNQPAGPSRMNPSAPSEGRPSLNLPIQSNTTDAAPVRKPVPGQAF